MTAEGVFQAREKDLLLWIFALAPDLSEKRNESVIQR
jgi:hypothetical protein